MLFRNWADKEMIKFLLKSGLSINKTNNDGKTALFNYQQHPEIITLLLKKGANPNSKDHRGNGPLYVHGNPQIIHILLNAGAGPNARNLRGDTPLFSMSAALNKDKTKLLVQFGADINIKNSQNETSLFYSRSAEVVKTLLKNNMDIYVVNDAGDTALHHWIKNRAMYPYRYDMLQVVSNYADIMSIKNRDGLTIVDIAKNLGDEKTLEWSKEFIGKSSRND